MACIEIGKGQINLGLSAGGEAFRLAKPDYFAEMMCRNSLVPVEWLAMPHRMIQPLRCDIMSATASSTKIDASEQLPRFVKDCPFFRIQPLETEIERQPERLKSPAIFGFAA